jgi:N-methylhydantoinase A
VEPLDEQAVRDALRALAGEGVEAIAICFLFSFRNNAHELRTAEIAREMLPDCFISYSRAC